MRLVQVTQPANHPPTKRKRSRNWLWLVAAVVGFELLMYARPLPAATIQVQLPPTPAPQATNIEWPAFGQSALRANGYGQLGTSGPNTPIATASIAKVITALCVLEKHPLSKGQSGPKLLLDRDDRLLYEAQVAQNGSRLPVFEGEEISQYEALEALMVPSANNIADSLAIWSFGSLASYAAYANTYLATHGLIHTTVGTDASGLDPSTKSTAEDLAKLGEIAQKNPVLMEIAGQKNVAFSYGGSYDNYNSALGTYGITGLKTGNNDENPGGLLVTATVPSGDLGTQLSGAVLGGSDLPQAIAAAQDLVASAAQNFETVQYVAAGQTVGKLTTAWGVQVPVVAEKKLTLTRWKSHTLKSSQEMSNSTGENAGKVGQIQLMSDANRAVTNVAIQRGLPGPSVWWRLTHWR